MHFTGMVLDNIDFLIGAIKSEVEISFKKMKQQISTRDELHPLLFKFMRTRNFWEAERLLEEYRQIVSIDSLTLISNYAIQAQKEGNKVDAYTFYKYFVLLQNCLHSGIKTAFKDQNELMFNYFKSAKLNAITSKERGAILYHLAQSYEELRKQPEAVSVYFASLKYFDPVTTPFECNEVAISLGPYLGNHSENADRASLVMTYALASKENMYFRTQPSQSIFDAAQMELFFIDTFLHWVPLTEYKVKSSL